MYVSSISHHQLSSHHLIDWPKLPASSWLSFFEQVSSPINSYEFWMGWKFLGVELLQCVLEC
jgi:hypothetical protein